VWAAIWAVISNYATAAGVCTSIFLIVIHWEILSVWLLGNRSCDVSFCVKRMIVASAKTSKEIGDEQDQQNGAQPNTSTTPITPAAMTVITSTAAQHQNQDNEQDQYAILLFYSPYMESDLNS
jgi:hypothetical protein